MTIHATPKHPKYQNTKQRQYQIDGQGGWSDDHPPDPQNTQNTKQRQYQIDGQGGWSDDHPPTPKHTRNTKATPIQYQIDGQGGWSDDHPPTPEATKQNNKAMEEIQGKTKGNWRRRYWIQSMYEALFPARCFIPKGFLRAGFNEASNLCWRRWMLSSTFCMEYGSNVWKV